MKLNKFYLRGILPLFFLVFAANIFAASEVDANFTASAFISQQGRIVQTSVQTDGKIIIAGEFKTVGKYGRTYIARLNADGSIDLSFNPVEISAPAPFSISITKSALQSDGKILLAGNFQVAGRNRGLIRLNADGSLDSAFSESAEVINIFSVQDLAIDGNGKIVFTGWEGTNGNTPVLSRLNPNGTLDIKTTALFAEIAVQTNGKIVAYNGNSFDIVRYNADLTPDNTFQAASVSGLVKELAIQTDGKIVAVGNISAVKGFTIKGIARLNTNGAVDTAFNIGTNGPNSSIETVEILADGKILVGGAFTSFNGTAAGRVARLNSSDGSLDTSFNSGISGENLTVYDLTVQTDGKIIAAGFSMFRLNANGSLDTAFTSPGIGDLGYVKTICVQPDNKILVGGYFTRANEKSIRHLARFNADGTVDNSFNQTELPSNGTIYTIALQTDGKIIAGGDGFGGGVRFNADGSLDTMISTGAIVEDIKIQTNGKILMSGAGYVKRFNVNGTDDTSFASVNVGGRIFKMAVQTDGKIIIVGSFTSINGTTRSNIARLNADGTLDTAFNPPGGANGAVYDTVFQPDGKILIGGDFTGINFDTTKKYLARLNSDGSLDTSFTLATNILLRTIKLQPDGKILIGGNKIDTGANPIPGKIARVNADGSLDAAFNNQMPVDQIVNDIDLQSDKKIILGGYFSRVNGIPKLGTARLLETPKGVFDFDGDGKTDISIFRPAPGEWWYLRSSDGGNYAAQFGTSTDKLVPADFTGDGKTDIAFWRPSNGNWFILRSEDSTFYAFPFGASTDTPIVGDFDADGKADPAIFRPSNATWFILKSTGGTRIQQFGQAGDRPIPADYDGDGQTDIAIHRPVAESEWWLNLSTTGVIAWVFGNGEDKPVVGDYSGDGRDDLAFWRPSTGEWYIIRSEDESYYAFPFGASSDIPAPGDYDGDGRFDATVFRPASSTWFIQRSTAGTSIQTFGLSDDKPLPNVFVP